MRVGAVLDERNSKLCADLLDLAQCRRDDPPHVDNDHRRGVLTNPPAKILRIETQGGRIRVCKCHPVSAVDDRKSCGEECISRHNHRPISNSERTEDDFESRSTVAGRDAVLSAHIGRKHLLELGRARSHRQSSTREDSSDATCNELLVFARERNSQDRNDWMIGH